MILNGTLISLQAVLAGAVATLQPECHVAYVDYNNEGAETPPAEQRTALNNITDVIILAAPPFNPTREVKSLNLYNKDTASVTVTIKTDDGTTERILIKATLLTLECLGWEKGRGWFALDANGNLKETTSSLFSSLTVTGGITLSGTASNIAIGSNYISNGGTDAGLSFDASNNATFSAEVNGQAATFATGVFTKASAGDVLQVTNGGSTPKSLYVYTDAQYVSLATSASASGNALTFDVTNNTASITINNVANKLFVTSTGINNTVIGATTAAAGSFTTLAVTGTIKAGGYTVATLPANAAGLVAYVTDQLTAAAAKGVAPTGGGAVTCYVMNTGAGWVGI